MKDFKCCPDDTLKEVMKDRKVSVKKLAIKTGYRYTHIIKVINGELRITDGFSFALGRALDLDPTFFYRLQKVYDNPKLRAE